MFSFFTRARPLLWRFPSAEWTASERIIATVMKRRFVGDGLGNHPSYGEYVPQAVAFRFRVLAGRPDLVGQHLDAKVPQSASPGSAVGDRVGLALTAGGMLIGVRTLAADGDLTEQLASLQNWKPTVHG